MLLAAAVVVGLVAVGCGGDGEPGADDGAIVVTMSDNDFTPTSISVGADETIVFRFVNEGDVDHEAFIGDEAAQEQHAEEMSDGEHGDDRGDGHGRESTEAAEVTVEPGESGEIIYRFEETGSLLIGCHIDDHYQSGMKARLKVT